MLLNNRVAAVTGGASGLGREMAATFAREGARVFILDLNLEAARETAASLPAAGDGPHGAIEVNVSSGDSVKRAFASLAEEAGRLHILVNSAGIREIVDLFELEEAEWRRVIDVNLTGSFLCAREAARLMLKTGEGGSIINISSVAGLRGFNDRPAYVSSKLGVVGLTYSLSKDLAPRGVRANCIAPGLMRTPLTEIYYSDEKWTQGIPDFVPMGRPGTPEDVARAALFLASDLSGFVSGVVLPVDGGFMAAGTFGRGATTDAPGRNQATGSEG